MKPQENESESHSVMSDFMDPMDYKVHGFLQARILEWVAIPFFRGQPRDQTRSPALQADSLPTKLVRHQNKATGGIEKRPKLQS